MAQTYAATTPVINLPETDRADFVMRVYTHVLAAVVAFVGFEVLLFTTGIAEKIYDFVAGSRYTWLLILGVFMVANMIVNAAATQTADPPKQYLGLFGLSAVWALMFTVPLWRVYKVEDDAGTIASAAALTAIGFAGLTVVAFITRKDLAFLRPVIMFGFVIAGLLIVGAILFGAHLGTWFSVAMIALSGMSILYQTQSIIRRYPSNAHVGAAVALFGSLMTMFWYVLRLLSRN